MDGGVKAAKEASEAAGVSIEGVTREDVTEGARKALAWLGYGEQRRKAESAPPLRFSRLSSPVPGWSCAAP